MAIGGRKMLAVGSACVVSVGVATALLWRKRMTVGKQAGGACPSSQWNEKEVCEWMRGLGVSEATRNVFQRERITGCVLMGLSEQDIALLSATKKDSELIFEAMKVGVNEPLEAFAQESQSLFVRLATGEQRTMAERKQLLQDVLYAFKSFQMLGPEQQASALLPLSRQVTAVIKLAEGAGLQATSVGDNAPQMPRQGTVLRSATEDEASIEHARALAKTLTEMLDKFAHSLQSAMLPPEEANALKGRVALQLTRVERIAQSMPEEIGLPLLQKCASIKNDCFPSVQEEPESGETSLFDLLRRLRQLFSSLKSTDTMALSAKERLEHCLLVKEEVDSILESAKHFPESDQRETVIGVCGSVRELLMQMLGLLQDEEGIKNESMEENSSGVDEADTNGYSFDFLKDRLLAVGQLVNSPQFLDSDEATKESVVMHVSALVSEVNKSYDHLGPNERLEIGAIIESIKKSLSSAVRVQVVPEETDAGDSESSAARTAASVLADIKNVISDLQNPGFLELPNNEREKVVKNALEALGVCRKDALGLGIEGNPLIVFVDGMVEPLEAMLQEGQAN